MKRFHAHLKSEKGSSMMMVIMVIMILTMFGTSLLVVSLSNVRLTEKYHSWTSEFLTLDGGSQQDLVNLEGMLKEADDFAQWYISNEVYKYQTPVNAVRTFNGNSIDMATYTVDLSNQANKLIFPIGGTSIDPSFSVQNYFYQKYLVDVVANVDFLDPDSYSNLVATYNQDVYRELYFLMARLRIDGQPIDGSEYVLGTYSPPNISVTKVFTNADGRKINFEAKVILPTYVAIEEKRHVTFKVNPLQTNAITARDGINFSANNSVVNGDIYGQNGDISLGIGADVIVRGNVYTNQDLVVDGNFGNINVQPRAAGNTLLKESIFISNNPTHYMDTTMDVEDISQVIENGSNAFWFFNQDNRGGNVYAMNLAISDAVTNNGSIDVDGNVWTYDDVALEGNNSTIRIDGNYFGMNSESGAGQHNQSSTIINNAYDEGSKIFVGNMFVPGLSFIRFDDGPTPGNAAEYFRTLESVSANNPKLFNAYNDPAGGWYKLIVDSVEYQFQLEDAFASANTPAQITSYINANFPADAVSNIILDGPLSGITGYSLGAVVAHNTESAAFASSGLINDSLALRNKYDSLTSAKIQQVFAAKTAELFLSGTTAGSKTTANFNTLLAINGGDSTLFSGTLAGSNVSGLGTNHMYYGTGNVTLQLGATPLSGIVYVDGNVTITGNGTFNGCIIANGSVTISSDNVTINYDESVITALMSNNNEIYRFFGAHLPGNFNTTELTVRTSGAFSEKKRFKTIEWSEEAN